jgi:hypothetical protein
VKKVDQHLSRTSSQQTADDLLNHRSRLGRLAGRLGAQYPARFLALRQAVVYLCVTNDPIPVLFAMREWVPNSNSDAGALVALLFLHGGIAEELETVAANVSALGGGERTNPILRSLANSDPAGERFSIFLADVYQSIHHASSLSGELQSELQDRFTMQLTEWARAALANPAHSDALQSLFVRLINIRNEALRHDILALIGSGPFVEERPMRVFAEGVRRRQMERNRGGQ